MKIGDKVVLITIRHGNSVNNPVEGKQHSCEGKITDIEYNKTLIEVNWSNGYCNSYSPEDLAIVDAEYNSIW